MRRRMRHEDKAMTARTVDINLEMREAVAEAESAIYEAWAFATLSFRFSQLPESLELPPPGVVIRIEGTRVDLARQRFGTRAAGYAVVTMLAACEQYLIRLLLIVRLAQKFASRPDRRLTARRFLALRLRVMGQGRSMNVNRLTDEILELIGTRDTDLSSKDWLRDTYTVRNCLVHKGGIVDEASAPAGVLAVRWRRMVLEVEGRIIETLPFDVDEGGVVSMRFVDAERQWRAGEPIELAEQDCSDVALSLVAFVEEIGNLADARLAALFRGTRQES
jgi:hypothetical protein